MAWRFQASKFKNTTPKLPKKEDTIFDVPIGNLSCTNNGIQASAEWLAFHIEGEGGKLGAVPIGTKGRRIRNDINIVCAHGEQVSDFAFMTYEDDLLATCSRDEHVKLWRLSRDHQPTLTTQIDVGCGRLMESIKPHSTASNIIALGSIGAAYVADVVTQKVCLEVGGITDKCQSIDWSEDGRLFAISADKGRQVLVFDPRASANPIQSLDGHGGMGREARVLFAGDRLISTGFTNKRVQEVRVFDTNKWGAPIHIQEFVSTTGVLIPHYDADTRLVFLSGKGTNKLFLMELQDRQPYMSSVYELTLPEQTLGATIGSKRRVGVMDGEVDTYYQLTKSTIVPTPCIVPRRSYRDFHADLFPETRGPAPGCSGEAWLSGDDSQPAKMSLAPKGSASPPPQEPTPPVTISKPRVQPVAQKMHEIEEPKPRSATTTSLPRDDVKELNYGEGKENGMRSTYQSAAVPPSVLVKQQENGHHQAQQASPVFDQQTISAHTPTPPTCSTQGASSPGMMTSPEPTTIISAHPRSEAASTSSDVVSTGTSSVSTPTTVGPPMGAIPVQNEKFKAPVKLRASNTIGASDRSRPLSQRVRPKSCVVGQITSKFRHVETLAGIKANNAVFSNLRNVNTRLPPETNGACVGGKFIAVPLSGPAGVIGIYDVNAPGKLPDGVMDGIFNKSQVTDLQWNPFDDCELAVGTDCGQVNIWRLTDEDGPRNEMVPQRVLKIGGEKISCLKWHPLALNLMALALSNNTIELWDVAEQKLYHRIASHDGSILSIAWSADGRRLASVGKDGMLYVHEPNTGDGTKVYERKVLESTRAARVLFACDDRIIIVIGLTKSSQRQVQMYDATTFDLRHIYTQQIDSATQPLVPHHDYDTNVLFLSGKGDRIVHMFEVIYDSPYLLPLTSYMAPIGGQTIAFHNKKRCNVMAVEFQVAWRLTEKSLEQLIFRVPRVKKDVFQADLFPDALVTWEPVTTANDWVAGSDASPIFRSLQPEGVFSTEPRSVVQSTMTTTRMTAPTITPATTSTVSMASPTEQNQNLNLKNSDPPAKPKIPEWITEPRHKTSEIAPIQAASIESATGVPDRKEIAASWSARIDTDTRLEQDKMDGVAEEEWVE